MEHETANTKSAKGTLNAIVKFNTTICALLVATWTFGALCHQNANSLKALCATGLLLALIVTISSFNSRLLLELEEPEAAE
jgi:hypothetical protein